MATKGGAQTRTRSQQRAYDVIKEERRNGEREKVHGKCAAAGCGKSATETHHSDYSRPRDVKYMCASHNRKAGKGKNA